MRQCRCCASCPKMFKPMLPAPSSNTRRPTRKSTFTPKQPLYGEGLRPLEPAQKEGQRCCRAPVLPRTRNLVVHGRRERRQRARRHRKGTRSPRGDERTFRELAKALALTL